MKYLTIILSFFTLVSHVHADDFAWTEVKGGYEGLTEIGVYSLKDCLTQCLYLHHCYVAGFDNSTNQCYIQMELEIKPVHKDGNSTLKTYHFRREEFYHGDVCWKKVAGKKLKGLSNVSYKPQVICTIYCIGSRYCNAMTYDTATDRPCWLQFANEASQINGESFEPSTTAVSYILDKPCIWQIKFLSK